MQAHQLIAMRLLEVVFHHVDLAAGYTFDRADRDRVDRTLRRGVRRWHETGAAPPLTLRPEGRAPLDLAGGGPEVSGTAGQLLLWLARGRADGVSSPVALPAPPPWA